MTAPYFLPFNFQPVSVSVKTASYTIPAGKYARVSVDVTASGTFTINAVTAISGAEFVNIDIVAATNATASYTVPSGYKASVSGMSDVSTTYSVNGNGQETAGANVYTGIFEIGPGGTFSVAGALGSTTRIQGVATEVNPAPKRETFWLPSGTVINGTGTWRAVVEEYNEIT